MRISRAGLVAALALTGCVKSTGILPAGPNTYSLTEHVAPIAGGGDEAHRKALEEANAYCQGQGREMLPVQMNSGDPRGIYGDTSYTATFRCLLPTDPEFKR
jgi:hypothetical protein